MLMCVQASYSLMIWSKGNLSNALTTASGVIPGTRKSQASPCLCWLVSLLPTASLTALLRKALLIIIGLPPSVVLTVSRNSASRFKFASSPGFGVLSSSRWSVCVNSARLKCGVTWMLRLGSSQTSADRPGQASPSSVATSCRPSRERPAQA